MNRRLGRGKRLDDEERRRRGGAVASPLAGGRGSRTDLGRPPGSFARGKGQAAASEPSMRSRFAALASGSQPAVVKMASFGGGGRLAAMVNYVSRNGDVVVENERGEELRGRDELSAVRGEWDHLMKNRAESRDIGLFRMEVDRSDRDGEGDFERAREILRSGFGDRSFAFNVSRGEADRYRIEGVVVLRDGKGERLTADAKASEIVLARMSAAQEADVGNLDFRFTGHGNGVEYGTGRVRSLVEKHAGAVENERGEQVLDAKRAGDLVQLEWRDELHSRKPRDVMHLIMSARAGTDIEAFRAAARDFLASEFTSHRYVFAVHDPSRDPKAEQDGGKRPHVHVHAIVAMRSDHGERIETTIASFRRWREGLAEHARAKGINMEMTDRRERASAPAYSKNQVRPVSRTGRTEHEGTTASAHQRYDRKRRDIPARATTDHSQAYAETARNEWNRLARDAESHEVAAFAREQLYRLETGRRRDQADTSLSPPQDTYRAQYRTELASLSRLAETDDMSAMTRSEFEAYEKRVETALFQAERVLPEAERANFDEIVAAARAHVNVRRDIMEEAERMPDQGRADGKDHRQAADDANDRWDDAVARHGLKAAEAANEVMVDVEHYREAIELADAGEIAADKASLQASLQFELARAAELGAAGEHFDPRDQ